MEGGAWEEADGARPPDPASRALCVCACVCVHGYRDGILNPKFLNEQESYKQFS